MLLIAPVSISLQKGLMLCHCRTQLIGIKTLRRTFMLHAQHGGESSRLTSDETARNDANGGENIAVATNATSTDQEISGMSWNQRTVWDAVAFASLVAFATETTFMLFKHFTRRMRRMDVGGEIVAADFVRK